MSNATQKDGSPMSIDPLDTLTREQALNLREKVTQDINNFLFSDMGRPNNSNRRGYEVYRDNASNPLFERMAWEVVNDQFDKFIKIPSLHISSVSRLYDYFYDFTTPGHDGSNMLTYMNAPWLRKARKDLAGYLLGVLSTKDLRDDNAKVDCFIRLAGRVLYDDIDFRKKYTSVPGNLREMSYKKWVSHVDALISKARPALQRVKQM